MRRKRDIKGATTGVVLVNGRAYGNATEIARFIGIKADIIYQAIRTGEIPSRVFATSRAYVKYEDALAWADSRPSGSLKSKHRKSKRKKVLEFMTGGNG